jgi:hypothetical protein
LTKKRHLKLQLSGNQKETETFENESEVRYDGETGFERNQLQAEEEEEEDRFVGLLITAEVTVSDISVASTQKEHSLIASVTSNRFVVILIRLSTINSQ